jgi:hypothetical protein
LWRRVTKRKYPEVGRRTRKKEKSVEVRKKKKTCIQ